MIHMKHSLMTRISICLLAGLLGFCLFDPSAALARVDVTREDDLGGEGDPLDSNDYTGGGGGSDSDLHEDMTAPVDAVILRIIRTIFVDESGNAFLPFFHNGVPSIQLIMVPTFDSSAVTHAN
jgi:hypothetical protein